MQRLSKKIIINAGIYENRVAILENNRLEDFYVEQEGTKSLFGNVYKGVVESIVQGIGAAFVNIGTGKNGFLHISDIQGMAPLILDEAEDYVVENAPTLTNAQIVELLKVGQEILVQVGKESIGTKGPRITTYLSIPGRYLVLTPFDNNIGISKRISDLEERNRIRNAIKQMHLPEGAGCIVRTAARGITSNTLAREMKYLVDLWTRIRFRAQKVKPPASLYEEYGLIIRTIRDQFTDDVEFVAVDSKEWYKNIMRFLNLFMPALKTRIKLYSEKTPIFEKFGIEHEIEKLFHRKISLKNGGSIVIEQTEGLVAIDVNTERFVGKKDAEDTIFKTNMEAAKEIARQIRLRDLGGIIVIDFIDMHSREHRTKVQQVLENSMEKDKAKTKILDISPIGVVEMTRQRVRKSLESVMYKECPLCQGRGLVKSQTTIALGILRKIEKSAATSRSRRLDVSVSPEVYQYIMQHQSDLIIPLRKRCGKDISFYENEDLNAEDYRIK